MAALCALRPCAALRSPCSNSGIRTIGRPLQLRRVRVQAGEQPDLSKQFSEFKQRMKDAMPEVEQQAVTMQEPRFSSTRSGEWNAGPTANNLRQQERQVLDAWTQERLMQLATGGTMLFVLLLLLVPGGLPTDARCTLPWC